MKKCLIYIIIIVNTLTGLKAQSQTSRVISTHLIKPLDKFFDAIKHKEQGPYESNNSYEIHYSFFKDSKEQLIKEGLLTPIYYSELEHDDWLCRIVILAYFRRYARKVLEDKDWYTLARIYNGGPNGHKKYRTKGYGKCVLNLTKD